MVVEDAPALSRISLELIQGSDSRLLFIRGDRLYFGNDLDGVEVVYRVTGWDPPALVIEREQP